ncbi:MAG: glyoxalase [Bacteroidetes bacterium]|jgi:catechol 2,3-dioxygenase-like lactoylglutathione lyase family enzyme|nr:glyoxalase [Bacteroidota bacterium]
MIKFAYTILYVKDVAATVSFYQKAFGLALKFISEKNEYAELVTGGTTLSFASHDLAKSNLSGGYKESDSSSKPFGMEIGFTTDDVEATVQNAVKCGAIEVEKAKTKPWGQTVAYVRDPDGFLIEICTPMN